ncbi:MAG: DsbC family protein, partial [Pseudomonadales bacterium]|nr:DsbC family protein [Pseudomonadales bacterium]
KVQLTKALSFEFSKQAAIVSAKATSIDGIYEVLFAEGSIIYTTLDGEYFFYGENLRLFKTNGGDLVDLTAKTMALAEKDKEKNRLPILQSMDRDDFIIFSPKGEVKTSVIVFTDIDCGYCRKLHSEIDSYLELGIEIKYAAFPRAGLSGSSYDKIVTAWCAPNQQETMTLLKSNQSVKMQTCDNPVAQQYQLGRQVGVTGTPSIFTEDGRIIPGYRSAKEMAVVLGL